MWTSNVRESPNTRTFLKVHGKSKIKAQVYFHVKKVLKPMHSFFFFLPYTCTMSFLRPLAFIELLHMLGAFHVVLGGFPEGYLSWKC